MEAVDLDLTLRDDFSGRFVSDLAGFVTAFLTVLGVVCVFLDADCGCWVFVAVDREAAFVTLGFCAPGRDFPAVVLTALDLFPEDFSVLPVDLALAVALFGWFTADFFAAALRAFGGLEDAEAGLAASPVAAPFKRAYFDAVFFVGAGDVEADSDRLGGCLLDGFDVLGTVLVLLTEASGVRPPKSVLAARRILTRLYKRALLSQGFRGGCANIPALT